MITRVFRHAAFATLCTSALVAGCGKGDKASDSAKVADSAAAAAAAAPAPAATAPAMTDGNILAKLDADNVADSSGGAMAAAKGTSASVKEFGKMMEKDHHMMHADVMALAKKLNVTMQMPANDPDSAAAKAAADTMASTPKGADWDKWYINHAVTDHEAVLKFAQDAQNATQNADLKAAIQKAAPVVQKHLDKAKAIQSKLGAM